MKKLLLLGVIVAAVYFVAPKMGIELPWNKPELPEEAATVYLKYADNVTAKRYKVAQQFATGRAAQLQDLRSGVQKWLEGGSYVAASRFTLKSFNQQGDTIEFTATYSFVPSGGVRGEVNPGNPKNWRAASHQVSMENTSAGWKVSSFQAQ